MSFIICNFDMAEYAEANAEADITNVLKEYEWDLKNVIIYEVNKPIEYEIKLVRKQTLVRKEK